MPLRWVLLNWLMVWSATFSVDALVQPRAYGHDGLQIEWKDRFLEVSGNAIPGGPIRIHYLEAYCHPGSTDRDWSETVIPHRSTLVRQSDDGRRIKLEDRLEGGVVVTHDIRAGEDHVSFVLHATNPTENASDVAWAQPCMRVDGFTGGDPRSSRDTLPPYVKKCFLTVDGEIRRLPTYPWSLQARYTPGQVYVPEGVNGNDVNPRPISTVRPSSGLTGCYSKDETMILAMAWEPCQEVFQGVITCIHSDLRIGGLMPQESKVIRGRLYVVPANEEALLRRFKQDFAEH